ncbi:transmembrane epididymal protein 1-like [Erinaceus europaeus]|uniref:Transmembrane epididymal protein 1-like n=1 Tax=Erinaceus europaeus TaxID=9365 RepID=A0A1S2ZX21_ERIEU|nr:transmembrane epididymal protein 1-like [Erinaceus europaeus]
MGGFEGHLYPGLALFLYGLYHALCASRALICSRPAQYPLRRPWSGGRWARLGQIHYVGLAKLLSACILVVQELHSVQWQLVFLSKKYPQRIFFHRKQWQHITLYATFFLSGCADLLSQHLLPRRCPELERGAQALGMALLLPLMVSHLQDTEGVELRAHGLLTQALFLLMLVAMAELWAPDSPQLWVLKAFLYMLAGSWLMHMGVTLFKPISGHRWMDDDQHDVIFVTTFFCWHVVLDALVILWVYGASSVWYRYFRGKSGLEEPGVVPCHLAEKVWEAELPERRT